MHARLRTAAFAFAAATLAVSSGAIAAETYSFDTGHSEIIFAYSHLGNSTQHGSFESFDGSIVIDSETPSNSRVEVVVQAASVATGVAPFDQHLRSADFFDVERFPEIRFVSTAVSQVGKDQVEIAGDLTIKDITRPMVLVATLNYLGDHPLAAYAEAYKDKVVAGFSATGQLLRSDFGVGAFAPLTGDLVDLTIETELLRDK